MASGLPLFSNDQWEFMAVLEALEEPIPIEVVGTLVPLEPVPLFDLLNRAGDLGLIRKCDGDVFGLAPDLSQQVVSKLKRINTKKKLSSLLDRLEEFDLMSRINRASAAKLFLRAGRPDEVARIEIELAREAIRGREHEEAMRYLVQAAGRLSPKSGLGENDTSFVAATLGLSQLTFIAGKGFNEVPGLLEKARSIAEGQGDRRSLALIDLHVGRLLYFSEKRAEALEALSSGRKIVEELGDTDILIQSAEFLALFFFSQGLFKEALVHSERAMAAVEYCEDRLPNPLSPVLSSLCAANLGQFHKAIGILDMHLRSTDREQEHALAVIYRAILGHMLLRLNKKREALVHLYGAMRDAKETRNALGLYFARAGLASHSCDEGRLAESRNMLAQAVTEATQAGIIRQWGSPWVLGILEEFDRLGYEPIPGFSYRSQMERALNEPSVHIRGVALRLKAKGAMPQGEDSTQVRSYLEASEGYLERSGDPVELAKTHLEMARLELGCGERDRARKLAEKAWEGLSGYTEEFFPDDLRYLLGTPERTHTQALLDSPESIFKRFLGMMEELIPSEDLNEILTRAVAATNRFLGAERGGLFWFQEPRQGRNPTLQAACNLRQREVNSKDFRLPLRMIKRCFQEDRPLVVRTKEASKGEEWKGLKAILCLPVEIGGSVRSVLYHDNSYLDDCFDFLEGPTLVRLVRHVSVSIDRVWQYARMVEEKSTGTTKQAGESGEISDGEILGRSSIMRRLLDEVERVAGSESIALLLGETGVGKELLARWIHERSPRREKPYVVIDIPTVPANLLESELFGYEKGAFTGADHRKQGRIELAHGGTLFLDEIGELPLSIQSKLLRVLDTRSFVRLGGSRVLSSDFRLLAATNRDLAQEVAKGRFRQDLYYRLNVVPLTVPPLRDRGDDVVVMAQHFLDHYARRFNNRRLVLTPEQEEKLTTYSWPGNIRELRNVMERAVLLSTEEKLRLDLPPDREEGTSHSFSDLPTMDALQHRYIQYVLENTGSRISGSGGAAEVLGMDRHTLYRRMKKLGIKRPEQ